jgi:hypothetical protein
MRTISKIIKLILTFSLGLSELCLNLQPSMLFLSLDPETVHSDFMRVKYHKDQTNDKDYSHEGLGFTFKK